MKTAEQIVDDILNDYYTKHHDKDQFRRELIAAVGPKLDGFSEAKRRIIDALDFRLTVCGHELTAGYDPVLTKVASLTTAELEKFRVFVKGMVIKRES